MIPTDGGQIPQRSEGHRELANDHMTHAVVSTAGFGYRHRCGQVKPAGVDAEKRSCL
jgi:hypothetical protein